MLVGRLLSAQAMNPYPPPERERKEILDLDCKVEVRKYVLVSRPSRWGQRGERVVVQSPMLCIPNGVDSIPVKRFNGEGQNSVCFLPKSDIEKDGSDEYGKAQVGRTSFWVEAHGVALWDCGGVEDGDVRCERGDRFWINKRPGNVGSNNAVPVINLRTFETGLVPIDKVCWFPKVQGTDQELWTLGGEIRKLKLCGRRNFSLWSWAICQDLDGTGSFTKDVVVPAQERKMEDRYILSNSEARCLFEKRKRVMLGLSPEDLDVKTEGSEIVSPGKRQLPPTPPASPFGDGKGKEGGGGKGLGCPATSLSNDGIIREQTATPYLQTQLQFHPQPLSLHLDVWKRIFDGADPHRPYVALRNSPIHVQIPPPLRSPSRQDSLSGDNFSTPLTSLRKDGNNTFRSRASLVTLSRSGSTRSSTPLVDPHPISNSTSTAHSTRKLTSSSIRQSSFSIPKKNTPFPPSSHLPSQSRSPSPSPPPSSSTSHPTFPALNNLDAFDHHVLAMLHTLKRPEREPDDEPMLDITDEEAQNDPAACFRLMWEAGERARERARFKTEGKGKDEEVDYGGVRSGPEEKEEEEYENPAMRGLCGSGIRNCPHVTLSTTRHYHPDPAKCKFSLNTTYAQTSTSSDNERQRATFSSTFSSTTQQAFNYQPTSLTKIPFQNFNPHLQNQTQLHSLYQQTLQTGNDQYQPIPPPHEHCITRLRPLPDGAGECILANMPLNRGKGHICCQWSESSWSNLTPFELGSSPSPSLPLPPSISSNPSSSSSVTQAKGTNKLALSFILDEGVRQGEIRRKDEGMSQGTVNRSFSRPRQEIGRQEIREGRERREERQWMKVVDLSHLCEGEVGNERLFIDEDLGVEGRGFENEMRGKGVNEAGWDTGEEEEGDI